jgi:arylsulfatase
MASKKKFTGTVGRTLLDTRMEFEVTKSPSAEKPNIVYIVLDDMGFSHLGCYGSTINTPNIDRLASEGLRYNNFHTTAICTATRTSLLTGANHHSAGIAGLTEFTTGLSNNQGGINPEFATLAEILHEYDYRNFAVGKWHLCGIGELTGEGPYTNWPLSKGFDNYYGFLACQMNQWNPTLTRDNTMVQQPKKAKDGYHLSEDLTDNAIAYIYHHEFEHPEQPFFLYLAYGAMHSPHNAPKEYIEKYKGKFDKGWDKIREEWFENQKRLGIVNDNAELTDRNELITAWDELSDDERKAYARSMEVFAGFLEHTDAQIGRLVEFLRDREILDNTIVVFISDNGTSPEGGKNGTLNHYSGFTLKGDRPENVRRILKNYDTIGDEYSFPHYAMGWANAGNTPFTWYKSWVHEGGIKDPLIIRYPKLIKDPGGIRRQFNHVSDITPTILDILGFDKPESIKGVHQKPLEGISFKTTIEDEHAAETKHVQYFEMFGNRSIYKDGWKAVVNHAFNDTFEKDEWELYHVAEDYSEKYNVADKYPEKLNELKEEWLIQAGKYNVFPMFPKPFQMTTEEHTLHRELRRLPGKTYVYKNVFLPHDLSVDPGLTSRTHSVDIALYRADTSEKGVLLSKGDRFGGITFYIKDNRLKYVYNADGETYYVAEADEELPLGDVKVGYKLDLPEFNHGTLGLFINDKQVKKIEIPTLTWAQSYMTSLRTNKFTSVYDKDYEAPFEYDGEIKEIVIDVKPTHMDMETENKIGASID